MVLYIEDHGDKGFSMPASSLYSDSQAVDRTPLQSDVAEGWRGRSFHATKPIGLKCGQDVSASGALVTVQRQIVMTLQYMTSLRENRNPRIIVVQATLTFL